MSANGCMRGVVGVVERDGRLLAIRRSATVRAAGCWCLPGGGIEPGETPEQAVIREMLEEVGMIVRPIRRVWNWTREDGQLNLVGYLVEAEPHAEPVANPAEVADCRWVTPQELGNLQPGLPSTLHFLDHYRQEDRKA